MTAREFIIAPENAGKSIVEIMQLFSDHQNKELREYNQGVTEHRDNLVKEIQRLHDLRTKEHTEKEAEIQRLTKEVKELKEQLGAANSAIYSLQENLTYAVKTKELENEGWKSIMTANEAELTRLRELLGRVHQGIKLDLMYIPGEKNRLQNLLTEIDNALMPFIPIRMVAPLGRVCNSNKKP